MATVTDMPFRSNPAPAASDDRSPEAAALDSVGFCAPLPLAEPERAATVVADHDWAKGYVKNPHVASQAVRHMLRDPGLVAAVRRFCGESLVLWRSAFFSKTEGSAEIGWHHDKHFQSGDADVRLDEIGSHFSILFGLTEITQRNGILEVVPGSHLPVEGLERDTRPFHKRPSSEHILRSLPENILAQRRPVPIPGGSFLVFHSAILHRSLPHVGGGDRLGMAIRLASADVEIPAALATPDDILPFPPAA